MNTLSSFIAIFLYLSCTLGLVLRIQSNTSSIASVFTSRSLNQIITLGFIAVLFHSYSLYNNVITDLGFQFGFFNAASIVGMVNSLLILVMSLKRQTELLATIVLPLTALTLLLETIYPSSHILPPESPIGLQIHVLVSIIAYSLLGLAALMSIILAMQNRLLHKHHTGGILHHLPALQVMEKLLFDSITAGFIGLSIALATGFLFLENIFAQHLVHKTALSLIAWMVFGTLLTGRVLMGWRGRIAIRWTLSGFATLMLAYFGSKFVLEFIIVS
jgi:ABC-type uncharacterized transport system permease subunit